MDQLEEELIALRSIYGAKSVKDIELDAHTRIVKVQPEDYNITIRFKIDVRQYPNSIDSSEFVQLVPSGATELSVEEQQLLAQLQASAVEIAQSLVGDVFLYSFIQQIEEALRQDQFECLRKKQHVFASPAAASSDANASTSPDRKKEKSQEFKKMMSNLQAFEKSDSKQKKGKKPSGQQQKKKADQEEEDTPEQKQKRKWEFEIFQRIQWDSSIPKEDVVIGFLDRFIGIVEKQFNEFKRVHEDALEGVPMHRIRYFKIKDQVVWDREKRIDLLSRGGAASILGTQSDAADAASASGAAAAASQAAPVVSAPQQVVDSYPKVQSLPVWRYNKNSQQWDSIQTQPQTTQIKYNTVSLSCCSYNVLYDKDRIFAQNANRRIAHIMDLLSKTNADVIVLQEVTVPFLTVLTQQDWVRTSYYLSDATSTTFGEQYGLLILSKQMPSKLENMWFSYLGKNALFATFEVRTPHGQGTEQLVVSTIHLSSNLASDYLTKRKKQLQAILDHLDNSGAQHKVLMGDFNFGEESAQEQAFLNQWGSDAWQLSNGSFVSTFDPSSNKTAAITSKSGVSRRLDKLVYQSSAFAAKEATLFGTSIVPGLVDQNNQRVELHPSDHYGLSVVLRVEGVDVTQINVKKVHTSAVCIIPPRACWDAIQQLRHAYDPNVNRWPPHVNLLYPFYEEDLLDDSNVLNALRESCRAVGSFSFTLDTFQAFQQGLVTLQSKDQVPALMQLHKQLQRAFPYLDDAASHENGYNPHMTIGKFASSGVEAMAQKLQTAWNPIEFTVDQVFVIHRTQDGPFRIKHVIPLGERPTLVERQVHPALRPVFSKFSLLPSEEDLKNKQAVLEQLNVAVKAAFGQGFKVKPFGSFALGIKSNDLDVVLVSNMDGAKAPNRSDVFSKAQSALESLTEGPKAVQFRYALDALVPVLFVRFDNGVELDLSYANIPPSATSSDEDLSQLAFQDLNSIAGLRECNFLLQQVKSVRDFQVLATLVKQWAKLRGVSSNTHGFLPGFSLLVMAAYVCRQFFEERENDQSLNIDRDAGLEGDCQVHLLVRFFKTFATWAWPKPLSLNATAAETVKPTPNQHMPILISTYPHSNSARNVTRCTASHTQGELIRALEIVSTLGSPKDLSRVLDQVFLSCDKEFFEQFKQYLVITVSAADKPRLELWGGRLESRLVQLLVLLENKGLAILPWSHRLTNDSSANSFDLVIGIESVVDSAMVLDAAQKFVQVSSTGFAEKKEDMTATASIKNRDELVLSLQ